MSARRTLMALLVFGYGFLYAPIVVLVAFSFNETRSAAVWGGFSFKWYLSLFDNQALLAAASLSLRIATFSATIATALACGAAFALERYRRLPGRSALAFLGSVPLVLPEVITGFALLLLFVWMEGAWGWPEGRGAMTISIAHITLGLAFAVVVIRARLSQLDPRLESAAADLGAAPATIFRTITLPLIAPALGAAWLLAFTLSLDDLVIASFVSGPGSSTLPIVIFSSVRLGVSPQVNALATLLVVVVASILGLVGWMYARHEGQRRQGRVFSS